MVELRDVTVALTNSFIQKVLGQEIFFSDICLKFNREDSILLLDKISDKVPTKILNSGRNITSSYQGLNSDYYTVSTQGTSKGDSVTLSEFKNIIGQNIKVPIKITLVKDKDEYVAGLQEITEDTSQMFCYDSTHFIGNCTELKFNQVIKGKDFGESFYAE